MSAPALRDAQVAGLHTRGWQSWGSNIPFSLVQTWGGLPLADWQAPTHPFMPFLYRARGRRWKSLWVKIKTGKSTYVFLSLTKQLGENRLNLLPIKIETGSEKHRQNLKHLSLPLYPRLNLPPSFPTPLPALPERCRGVGLRVSTQQYLLAAPFSSQFSSAPAWVLSQPQLLGDKPAPAWAPLHGAQFLSGTCSCTGPSPQGAAAPPSSLS